jgi:hypothetical protein
VGSAGRLVLGTAGAVIGGIYGGPTGAQIGWAAGSALGGAVFPAPAQKVQGPRLGDLKVTGVEYGQPIPYVQGMMRVPGQVWWASNRREIAHTTTEDAGGKGGGQEVERTDYTYEVDILYGLTSNEIVGVTRIWLNGKLIWTNLDSDFAGETFIAGGGGGLLATAIANALSSLTASSNTSSWTRMTVYTGEADQNPDPTYEAAVGTEDAVAYRGRGSIFIEGLQLGSSGVIPNLTFEVVTKATGGESSVDSNVLLQCEFDNDSSDDISFHDMTDTLSGQGESISSGVFRMPWVASGSSLSAHVQYSGGDIDNHAGQSYTEEFYVNVPAGALGTSDRRLFRMSGAPSSDSRIFLIHNSGDAAYLKLYHRTASLGTNVVSSIALNAGVWTHVALVFDIDANTLTMYFDGVEVIAATSTGFQELPSGSGVVTIGSGAAGPVTGDILFDDVRVTLGKRYTAAFTPTARGSMEDPVQSAGTVLVPIPEDLADVVSRLSIRAGLSASQYDVSSLQSSPQTTVRGMAITQVTSTRSVIEMLMQAYFFEAHVSDKVYFIFRGGSSVETIDFEDMGATESDDSETFQLVQGNDIEFPAQVSLTYANWYDDYQNDTQESDRLVSAVDRSVSSIQLPLALTPTEAKTIADKLVLDQYVSLVSSNVRLLGEYANIEPTDIISPTDKDGISYRMRVVDVLDNYPVLELQVVMDNATVLTHIASTSSDYEPSIVVEEPPTSLIELMDIPILRDVDDESGFYAAMKGSNASNWPGGSLFQSTVSDTDFSEIKLFQDSAVFGTCSSTLGDWDSGRLFDWQNTVTLNVGEGTLSSSTRSAVLNDSSVNAMLIGNEIIQFITATLVSTGVYTLSGLLRGCRGTEWAMTGHASDERCVLLRNAGLRRIAMQSNELGSVRYYAGVTIGRTLSSGLTGSPAEGEAFTNTGRGLAPFNPVYLRFARETNGDITITGQRRSRLGVRMTGSLGINVPDDDTTSWLLDIQSNEGSPQTVYRTLTGSVSGTEITWTYSAANQATDFGSPTPTQISVGAYGYSSTVGRGEGKFKTGAV